MIRSISAILMLVWFSPVIRAEQPANTEKPDAPSESATPEQIGRWIADLTAPRFVVRENATKALIEAGGPAVEPLGIAASGDDPEASERAIWILRNLADRKRKPLPTRISLEPVENGVTSPTESPDPAVDAPVGDPTVRQAALEQLVKLKFRPALVTWAAEGLVTELGAKCLPAGLDPQLGRDLPPRVVIDRDWRGRAESFAYVATITNHTLVQIIGTDITADDVRKLKSMKDLTDIQLYGTRISEEEKNKLVADMPNVTFDYRRGALLGVVGGEQGLARIDRVQPGSAAAAAGLHPGDIVQSFNGQPVANFKELTDGISKFQPGDEAKLEILRGDERLTKTVKFGSW